MSSPPPKFVPVLRGGNKPDKSLRTKIDGEPDPIVASVLSHLTEEEQEELGRLLWEVIEQERAAGKKMLRIL